MSSAITNERFEDLPLDEQVRQRIAIAIWDMQERIPIGSLFIALYIRGNPPKKDDFHWVFYLHQEEHAGTKYHDTSSPKRWMARHRRRGYILNDFLLCVLIAIGKVLPGKFEDLERIMDSHNQAWNSIPGLSCRVWIWMVMQDLIKEEVVWSSGTIYELEAECLAFGNQYSEGASRNEQPRPVVVSASYM
ncbi:uncharacterized protein RCC_03463 [Ramularia collo-cygni]|uniref:Uncharacterized protein n=1 Tax=Ramularia collo-cygni TaxID=112498 RepID=A0A2D3V274_9PEZI|nr:uncharacterized protein RCC_03463 [Ramularia collo-cygni]CZT17626.1 uncharacterized protein RCC_03463 [Ramularia collo-cygni]